MIVTANSVQTKQANRRRESNRIGSPTFRPAGLYNQQRVEREFAAQRHLSVRRRGGRHRRKHLLHGSERAVDPGAIHVVVGNHPDRIFRRIAGQNS